jgi:peptide chain release factor subunit 1
MTVVEAARRLVAQRPAHLVVSLYLDLDPERFATPPARSSQINSLVDGARREVEADKTRSHEDHLALREDLERIREYLHSSDPPFEGAHALGLFCSLRDDMFEVVQLTRATEGRVVIDRTPYIEPLIAGAIDRRWCVALVNRREARLLTGPAERISELKQVEDDVHGQHQQGGWSQSNYERSVEHEVDDHLRHVAELLDRRWRAVRYDRLALGGPVEDVSRLEGFLPGDIRPLLVSRRLDVDMSSANEAQIRAAVADLVEEDERHRERAALDRLAAGIGTPEGHGVGGPEDVLTALNERRVETLLLEPGFDRPGGRCPACGLLTLERDGECPADGTPLEEVEHLREAVVEAAIAQDAEVMVVSRYPDLGPLRGVAAILRF